MPLEDIQNNIFVNTNIRLSRLNNNKTDIICLDNVSKTDNKRVLPLLPTPPPHPLGNITSYYATINEPRTTKGKKPTEAELNKLKYDYKKLNIERKKKIGKKVDRVAGCGIRLIDKNREYINAVKGEKGGIYYSGVQRCGCVWFCPDCMYKLMKSRATDLYDQLKIYKEESKTILFLTFTLQHKHTDRLTDLRNTLQDAFSYANGHRQWIEAKKNVPVEYLRALEVLMGSNGWHPHYHSIFVGSPGMIESINIFKNLYEKFLLRKGLVVNEHTIVIDKWNGKMDSLTDYVFKGMIEEEITGGNLRKSGKGKNFFELIDEGNDRAASEYVKAMKGKRQYHHSKNFFSNVTVKTDEEILTDDVTAVILYQIHRTVYADMRKKGIALHFLNEFIYGGEERARRLMELYDCDTDFMGDKSKKYG